jgi:hypothetical protein
MNFLVLLDDLDTQRLSCEFNAPDCEFVEVGFFFDEYATLDVCGQPTTGEVPRANNCKAAASSPFYQHHLWMKNRIGGSYFDVETLAGFPAGMVLVRPQPTAP